MGLTDRIRSILTPERPPTGLDEYRDWLTFNGTSYPIGLNQTLVGDKEEVDPSYAGLVSGAYQRNAVIFACMSVRQLLFAEARFQFRQMRAGRPGDLFGNGDLALLEHPWPGGTTGDLLTRAIQDADLAGNFFAVRRPGRIRRMRPDWVTIVLGSDSDPDSDGSDIDAEVIGFLYHPGGRNSGHDPVVLQRTEVCHFAPIPDPLAHFRGMSWLTPVLREIAADSAATSHKLKFFENGATPNLVVKLAENIALDKFAEWVAHFRKDEPSGLAKAYKTLYLNGGMDATVVGTNLRQLDFKQTQGAGETRIAAAAGVPPVIVGLSEGLQAATYSNYGQARRRFADGTMRPLWRNMASSLEMIVHPPAGASLWYDDRDIPFLAEDKKDSAEVHSMMSSQIAQLTREGFTSKSVVDAVVSGDFTRLVHTGLFSVQLQRPGAVDVMEAKPVEPVVVPKADSENGNGRGMDMLMAYSAGQRAIPAHIEVHASPVEVHPTNVTFERGAIETTIEPTVVNVTTPDVSVVNADSVEMDSALFAGAVADELREVFDQPVVREVERDDEGRPVRVTERRVKRKVSE